MLQAFYHCAAECDSQSRPQADFAGLPLTTTDYFLLELPQDETAQWEERVFFEEVDGCPIEDTASVPCLPLLADLDGENNVQEELQPRTFDGDIEGERRSDDRAGDSRMVEEVGLS